MSTRLEDLHSLRATLLESLKLSPPDNRAPLAGQLRATLSEIELIESRVAKAGDPVDELAARRVARGAGPAAHTG